MKNHSDFRRKLTAAAVIAVAALCFTACSVPDALKDKLPGAKQETSNVPADSETLSNNAIGASVTLSGMTVAVTSAASGTGAGGRNTLSAQVTYSNVSGKDATISPYDWNGLSSAGPVYVDGKTTFAAQTLKNGRSRSCTVHFWSFSPIEGIQYDPSKLNADNGSKASWTLTGAPVPEETTPDAAADAAVPADAEVGTAADATAPDAGTDANTGNPADTDAGASSDETSAGN